MSQIERQAYVQVWGKGFRVTEDTEEFQLLIPKHVSALQLEIEKHIHDFRGWGKLLESLYDVPRRVLAGEYCVLFHNDQLCAVSINRSEDRFKRKSPVVIAACAKANWMSDDVGELVARLVGLSQRLARDYADVFRGAPTRVQGQLRDEAFLPNRQFDLGQEPIAAATHWREVIAAVREWQAVDGVATLRLLPLGGNVLIGTKHEMELVGEVRIDGRYDVAERRIEPFTSRLKPWPKPGPGSAVTELDESSAKRTELESIDNSLRNIDRSIKAVSDALVQFLQDARDFWFPRRPPE